MAQSCERNRLTDARGIMTASWSLRSPARRFLEVGRRDERFPLPGPLPLVAVACCVMLLRLKVQ